MITKRDLKEVRTFARISAFRKYVWGYRIWRTSKGIVIDIKDEDTCTFKTARSAIRNLKRYMHEAEFGAPVKRT